MIVGYKTERFITVKWKSGPDYGYQAFGIEQRSDLHATKGWRRAGTRRQLIGWCEKRDAHRARTRGSSDTFKHIRRPRYRGVAAIPITEKMLMRHAWYRKKKAWDAFRASLPQENQL